MRRKKEQEIIQNGMKARISDLEYTVSKAFEEKRELSKKLQQRLAEIV